MQAGIGIVTFDTQSGAEQLLASLKKLEKNDAVTIEDAVIVVKDTAGETKVTQTADLTQGKGAAKGGTLGFTVGLLLGGPIGGALLGAAAGALLSRKVDLGVPDEKISMVTDQMPADSSALFVQGRTAVAGLFKRAVEQSGGTLHTIELSEQAAVNVQNAAAMRYQG